MLIGDNSDKLCQLCTGAIPGGKCTPSDPYAGFSGAFRCLVESGDIAFLRHTTVVEMTTNHYQFREFISIRILSCYWKMSLRILTSFYYPF